LPHLAAVLGAEIFMQRTVEYRGFEIHIDLESTSEDMFDGRAGFVLRGPSGWTRRWLRAYDICTMPIRTLTKSDNWLAT
jgi:hypothetical protein